jgi:transposase
MGRMPRSRIALEHSPWVSRLLAKFGHEAIVAHARNVRRIGESRKKDDRLDAQTLARLARIDPQLLCPVKHRSAKAQADLTVIRARAGLRTALVNTAQGLAGSYGERLRGCNENAQLAPSEPITHRECGWKDGDSCRLGRRKNLVSQ